MKSFPGYILVFLVVTSAVSFVRVLDLPMASVIIPALWGAGALVPGLRAQRLPPLLGLRGSSLRKGLKLYFLSSIVIFPIYSILFILFLNLGFPRPAGLIPHGITVFQWTVYNFAVVAFIEELFFRGYMQGRLEEHAGRCLSRAWGVRWMPVFLSAFFFALAHAAADLDPARMVVFFPGLLFGWLRAGTGAIMAPVLSHGTANLVSMLLIKAVIGE